MLAMMPARPNPSRGGYPLSVLVEAVTLVVRRQSLDRAYPGGAEAFLCAARALECPPRFACASDPLLVNVSFGNADHVTKAIELLKAHGLVDAANGEAMDFVVMHQFVGPTRVCPWLEWERFTDSVTVAWMKGSAPGELAAPQDWTAEDPCIIGGDDETTPSERFLPLAVNDGTEILLDLDTGSQVERRAEVEAEEAEASTPVHSAMMAALDDVNWPTYHVAAPAAMVDMPGQHALYTCRYWTSEAIPAVVCYTRSPLLIPKASRRKTMEFITRANYGILFGAFEMNLEDGRLFFRATCAIEDGVLTTRMVTTLANVGVWAFDKYYPKLLEMVYAKRSAADAVREAEA